MQLFVVDPAQKLLRLFQNMAVMPFVCRIYKGIVFVQHDALDGRTADIKTYSHVIFLPDGVPPEQPPVWILQQKFLRIFVG